MNSKLKFLTSEDYYLLWEKGKLLTDRKNKIILPENHSSEAIYLLRKGIKLQSDPNPKSLFGLLNRLLPR